MSVFILAFIIGALVSRYIKRNESLETKVISLEKKLKEFDK